LEPGAEPDLDAQRLRIEAIGEPGQRRFRLLAIVGGETWVIWMEKEHARLLGHALEQMLEQLPDRGPELGATAVPLAFDLDTRHQFRVGRMELGYDERRDRLVIIAHDVEDDAAQIAGAESETTFACRLSREQARDLSAEAAAVVAAGRPRCTMCGAPMGAEPHVCPQQNGHLPHELGMSGEADEDEEV
jgi:uncharacterized repeat protein (TIGR03847 family)